MKEKKKQTGRLFSPMKKIFAFLLTAVMLFAAVAVVASADGDQTIAGSVYTVITPKSITFDTLGKGEDVVAVKPQGGSTLDALIDGDLSREVTTFNEKGVVLVQNVEIPALSAVADDKVARQEVVPSFGFVLDLGESKKFDAVYMAVFHEIATCIAIPGENEVIIETSSDGKTFVPVGDDGKHYFYAQVGDYAGAGDKGIDERVVPLKKAVSARYVRLSFTFMPVPEGGYWQYYTTIYEWCGFTEVGVANYKSGKRPVMLTKEQATADPTPVEGKWIGEKGDDVVIYEFKNDGGDTSVTITIYAFEDYEANGEDAEVKSTVTAKYDVLATHLTLSYGNNEYDEFDVEYTAAGDDTPAELTIGSGADAINLTTWTAPVIDVPNSEDPSSDEPGNESGNTSTEEEPSVATSSEESSKPTSSTSSTASTSSTSSTTSTAPAEDGGFPTWAIVLIVVGVVAVVAVVVVVVIKKRK